MTSQWCCALRWEVAIAPDLEAVHQTSEEVCHA